MSQAWHGSSGVILFLAFLFLLPSCTMCGWAARRCLEATLRVSRALARTFLPFGAGLLFFFLFFISSFSRESFVRCAKKKRRNRPRREKNVRTSARLTRKVASKHRRAAQPHIVQLSRRNRKVRKRVTPELPCHAWLTTGDRNVAKWKAALKCLQWRHCRWRPPRRRGHRRCATRRSRA